MTSGQATDSCRHMMSYHENMIFQLVPWKPLDHVPLRNPLVPDVRITAGRSRGFLEPYPHVELIVKDFQSCAGRHGALQGSLAMQLAGHWHSGQWTFHRFPISRKIQRRSQAFFASPIPQIFAWPNHSTNREWCSQPDER